MTKIIQLGEPMINIIGSGEILENASSFIKELVENSIDAGSAKINIHVWIGSKSISQICVTDDGFGIPKLDASLLCKRYHTSKIKDLEDIRSIKSLGFRGEGLNAISQNAQITLVSNTCDDLGWKAIYSSGCIVDGPIATAAPRGTTIKLNNLFYLNDKKRKICLRETAMKEIDHLFRCFACFYHNIRFELCLNNHTILQSCLKPLSVETVRFYFPQAKQAHLVTIDSKGIDENFRFIGVFSGIDSEFRDSNYIFCVNGRLVQIVAFEETIRRVYSSLAIAAGKYSGGHFVWIDFYIKQALLDINVSANKEEIKILGQAQLCKVLEDSVLEYLKDAANIKRYSITQHHTKFNSSNNTQITVRCEPNQRVLPLKNVYPSALECLKEITKVNRDCNKDITLDDSETCSKSVSNQHYLMNAQFLGATQGLVMLIQERDELILFRGKDFLYAYLKYSITASWNVGYWKIVLKNYPEGESIMAMFKEFRPLTGESLSPVVYDNSDTCLWLLAPCSYISFFSDESVSYLFDLLLSNKVPLKSKTDLIHVCVMTTVFSTNTFLKCGKNKTLVDELFNDALECLKNRKFSCMLPNDKRILLNLEKAYKLFERC